jgi:hypothetical protein
MDVGWVTEARRLQKGVKKSVGTTSVELGQPAHDLAQNTPHQTFQRLLQISSPEVEEEFGCYLTGRCSERV